MPTYTPRLLIYDRAAHFGSMRRINELYAEPETPIQEGMNVIEQPQAALHPFQDALATQEIPDGSLLGDDNVKFWSDYNTQFYNPQSYLPIVPRGTSYASDEPFESYTLGRDAFHERDARSDIMDSDVRPFLEECDLVQGISMVSDIHDAWSGFSQELVVALANELPKLTKIFHAVQPREIKSREALTRMAQVVHEIHDTVDHILPLCADARYSTTASAGLWMHGFTMPFRRKETSLRMADLSSFYSPGRKILIPRLSHAELSSPVPLGRVDRQVRVRQVIREDKGNGILTELRHGRLSTTLTFPATIHYPTAFPDILRPADEGESSFSLIESDRGVNAYLKGLGNEVSLIRGAAGHADRKELVEALTELRGTYRDEEQIYSSDEESQSD